MSTPPKSGVLVFVLHKTLKHSTLPEGASFGESNRPLGGNTQDICSGCPCISMHMTLRERDLALSEWQGVCSKRMCCPWVMDQFHWMRSEGRDRGPWRPTVGKIVTVKSPENHKVQQLSTIGMQQVHYQSLENHKVQQLSTMYGIWFGSQVPDPKVVQASYLMSAA
jgi:hypothetical protein